MDVNAHSCAWCENTYLRFRRLPKCQMNCLCVETNMKWKHLCLILSTYNLIHISELAKSLSYFSINFKQSIRLLSSHTCIRPSNQYWLKQQRTFRECVLNKHPISISTSTYLCARACTHKHRQTDRQTDWTILDLLVLT